MRENEVNPLLPIEPFIEQIEELTHKLSTITPIEGEVGHKVAQALNGALSKTLRVLVPVKILRESGAFFTGDEMADLLLESVSSEDTSTTLDAACGGGNLLLARARLMPLEETWSGTLQRWGESLLGFDIHDSFVRATHARLSLLAAYRGVMLYGEDFFSGSQLQTHDIFPRISQADSLCTSWPKSDLVLLNPPFNKIQVPDWCSWSTSKSSNAALFIAKSIQEAKIGTRVRAILPDVLRSGSFYRRWRLEVEKGSAIQKIQPIGRFDAETSVDVFVIDFIVGGRTKELNGEWWESEATQAADKSTQTVGDLFDVYVGRVVPHRDAEQGNEYPYLDVSHVPTWGVVDATMSRRRFNGVTFKPPFVVVRRNSRSKDKHRAVGAVVKSGPEEFAVENHLIIVRPKSGTLRECNKLIKVLQDQETSNWLNKRICCRHLTVSAVKCIPYSTKH